MSDSIHHCPFLNRCDDRCSTNFSLERLSNAYDYCVGDYAACGVYRELLTERRQRRAREAAELANHAWQPSDADITVVPLTHGGRRVQLV